jgi:GNAT superfamily N-acetyltransferase
MTRPSNPPLPCGYSFVPEGKIASVVTYLEMKERPPERQTPAIGTFPMPSHWPAPDLDKYRALYRMVGQDWLWFSRLRMSDDDLQEILLDPLVQVYVLSNCSHQIGLLELDFREPGQCELAFLGLKNDAIGKGAGRFFMNFAIECAWSRPVTRFWVHTCSFDHTEAVPFYRRSGFRPYAVMIEVVDDPRLIGVLPREAAPPVPLLDS